MHINTNPSEVCSVKLWELGRFPCSFCFLTVWNHKLVAVRVVALDTSRPMATDMWDCGLRWGREGRSGLRAVQLMSRATRRRRALVLVAVGASQGWSALLLSLPALGHHLVGLGVLVNVDRQAESKVSSHAHVFDSMWAFQPVRFELVSSWRIVNHHSRFSLSLSLSLSLPPSLSSSSRLTTHRYAHRQPWKLETVLEDKV